MPLRKNSLPSLKHSPGKVRVGCAGWGLTDAVAEHFPGDGTHLARYSQVLTCVEINSSFYRPHRPETYARWRDSVPDTFRFSVKIPKAITHDARLENCEPLLDAFLESATQLGATLGCWLVQLPPSLAFDPDTAEAFFASMRERTALPIALEARHESWFEKDVAKLLKSESIAYVDADPQPDDCFIAHRADTSLAYFRLHGSPDVYQSSYEYPYLDALALTLHDRAKKAREVWCVFDNTAAGAAQFNALRVKSRRALTVRPKRPVAAREKVDA
jgi:uncharacterized protein YecE (DUF72 family)